MRSEKLYSILAKVYDLIILKILGYEVAADYFVQQLPFTKNDQVEVLDAGCGTGLYTFAILKKFPAAKITAFDLNDKMLEEMENKLKARNLENSVKVFKADILSLFFENNKQFDLIITGGVLEHLDIIIAIKNLSKYLKTGGSFLNAGVRKNFFGKTAGKVWGLKNLFSKDETINAFKKNGYLMVKYIKLPIKYFLIRLAKEAYIFKKL